MMRIDPQFSTFPQAHFCGNARNVENSNEFPTFLCKSLRDLHIPTKESFKYLYIFFIKLVYVYADLTRKTISLLTGAAGDGVAGYPAPDHAVLFHQKANIHPGRRRHHPGHPVPAHPLPLPERHRDPPQRRHRLLYRSFQQQEGHLHFHPAGRTHQRSLRRKSSPPGGHRIINRSR